MAIARAFETGFDCFGFCAEPTIPQIFLKNGLRIVWTPRKSIYFLIITVTIVSLNVTTGPVWLGRKTFFTVYP